MVLKVSAVNVYIGHGVTFQIPNNTDLTVSFTSLEDVR